MNELIDPRARFWAAVAVIAGIALYIALDLIEDPDATLLDIALNLLEVTPLVLTTAGLVVLFQVTRRQRDEHLQVIRDLEIARVQGQRWRSEARAHLKGLGEAIDAQFSRWNLTEAEREVALLLLKGLSNKEVAAVRATSERTAREQSRSIYSKAGLTGRAALSAFFLEDLLAPIEGLEGGRELP
ncbi:MAG: helix-turn-helix transcriptional regulator [Gammaproteobacteria bacterium]